MSNSIPAIFNVPSLQNMNYSCEQIPNMKLPTDTLLFIKGNETHTRLKSRPPGGLIKEAG